MLYNKNQISDLSLTEKLAIDRTSLGNKRTFLAAIRTSLAIFAVGIGFIKFISHVFFQVFGYALMGAALLVLILGIIEYALYYRYLNRISDKHQHLKNKKNRR